MTMTRVPEELTFDETLLDEIIGTAANLLEELPEFAKVFITSGDLDALVYLEQSMEEYLISDVEFVPPYKILQGALRGRQGVLLIMGSWVLTDVIKHRIWQEQNLLDAMLRRR